MAKWQNGARMARMPRPYLTVHDPDAHYEPHLTFHDVCAYYAWLELAMG